MASERSVLWKLKVAEHEDNARLARQFEDRVKKANDTILKSSKKRTEEETKGEKKSTDDQIKAREEFASKSKRILDRMERQRQQLQEKERRETSTHLQKLTARYDAAKEKIQAGNDRLHSGLTGSAAAIAQLTGGFAMLGLVGEKDLEKLLRSLVRVKAVLDTFVGTVELYRNMREAVIGYRAALEASAVVEEATRAKSIAAIKAEVTAENALTAARGRSSAALTARSGLAGRAAASGTAAAGVGGFAAPLAAFVAAITATTAAIIAVRESITGKTGEGSLSHAMGEGVNSYEAWVAKTFLTKNTIKRVAEGQAPYYVSQQTAEKLVTEDETRKKLFRDNAEKDSRRFDAERSLVHSQAGFNREDSILDRLAGRRRRETSAQDRLALVRRESHIAASNASGARDGLSSKDASTRGAAIERLLTLSKRQSSLAEERLRVEREIASVKGESARKAIESAKQERDLVNERIKAERDRLLSAKERFGQLDPKEQQRIISAKQRAERLGFESLTRDERSALRSVGTSRTESLARAGDLRAADRAGFDRFFGSDERRNISRLSDEGRKLDVAIADKRKIEVELKRNDEALAKLVADQVTVHVVEQADLLEQKIKLEIERRLDDITRRQTAADFNRNAAFKKR